MEFFTTSYLTASASALRGTRSLDESAKIILAREADQYNRHKTYDIFLSHSAYDATVIYGLKRILEGEKISVYVYWVEDSSDASKVTSETAEHIRARMRSCKALFYATSEYADHSKWMPWELGYFDGIRGKVAVCPITNRSTFEGREYLGLYPIMEKDLWLHKDGILFKRLQTWLVED